MRLTFSKLFVLLALLLALAAPGWADVVTTPLNDHRLKAGGFLLRLKVAYTG